MLHYHFRMLRSMMSAVVLPLDRQMELQLEKQLHVYIVWQSEKEKGHNNTQFGLGGVSTSHSTSSYGSGGSPKDRSS